MSTQEGGREGGEGEEGGREGGRGMREGRGRGGGREGYQYPYI